MQPQVDETLDELTVVENRRQDWIGELEAIDVKRREIQARIMILNRQRDIPKSHIARLKAESAELLQKRTNVRNELGRANRELAVLRQLRQGVRVPESVAQAFVRIARRMMPAEMFNDIMAVARDSAIGTDAEQA